MQEKQPNINDLNSNHKERGMKVGSSVYGCPTCNKNTVHDIYEIIENGIIVGTQKVCKACREKEGNKFILID